MTTTKIATSSPTDITIRGKSLTKELIGRLTFTEMLYFQVLGREATPAQTAMIDACLVALMEHGLTPSAIAARLVYGSSPEAMQGAIAAGLGGIGSRFVGTVEGCGRLLVRIVAGEAPTHVVAEHRKAKLAVPGFGHDVHAPDDPRTPVLFDLARQHGVEGPHVHAANDLSTAVDAALGRHLTLNATGAVAAVLLDCGVPVEIVRGFAILSRCAGLVGHIHEEQHTPSMRALWEAAERAVTYEP